MTEAASTSPKAPYKNVRNYKTFFSIRVKQLLILFFAGLCLNGCASLGTTSKDDQQNTSIVYEWQALQQRLNALSSWELLGKVGIRSPQNNFTAAIHRWTQVDDFFNIDIASTFFGIGASNLTGNASTVMLSEAGEAPTYSDQPNTLIQEQLGLPLPITHLSYWIKGLPLPGKPVDISFNDQGLPIQIQQIGWTINYSKHTLHGDIPLPGKIRLSRKRTTITLAIKQWTLI